MFCFWPHHTACRTSLARKKPVPPAVEALSLNHQTTREVLNKKCSVLDLDQTGHFCFY